MEFFKYSSFHKTLPVSSAFVNWISVRFYETACINITFSKIKIKTYLGRVYVLVLPKYVVTFFFFLNPLTFLFVKRLDSCLYSKYLEFNQKINGNGFIAMTLIMNEKLNTASNMINAGIIKYLDGVKH